MRALGESPRFPFRLAVAAPATRVPSRTPGLRGSVPSAQLRAKVVPTQAFARGCRRLSGARVRVYARVNRARHNGGSKITRRAKARSPPRGISKQAVIVT